MNKILLFMLMICSLTTLFARSFYIDPQNGNINNNGTSDSPWSTFEEVISHNLIESYSNTLPYNSNTNHLKIKNENAPVKGGDTLILRGGLHGNVFFVNYNNLKTITVIAEEGNIPILKKLRLQACSKWRFIGLTISSEPYGEYIHEKLVFIESHSWQGPSSKIDIIDCEIYSSDTPWNTANDWVSKVSDGIYLNSDSINIINNELRNVDMGISIGGNYVNVINNKIINFSGDGIRMVGSHILAEANLIKNCYDVDENHDDGIQSWTTNGAIVDYNIVRSNIILNYEDENQPLLGSLQGIGCFDGIYHNWIVENNLISVDHYHGITFLGADSCKIVNNTVLDPTPDITPDGSWIMIDDSKNGIPSSNCLVQNNVANKIIVKAKKRKNFTLTGYTGYDSNFLDYKKSDFHLKPGSVLIDKGIAENAPAKDIENNERIGLPDIGAYEYIPFDNLINNDETDEIAISPNPVKDHLKIINITNEYEIFIYDTKGALKYRTYCKPDKVTLDLRKLETGMYFIVFVDQNKMIKTTEKLIKLDF